MTRLITFKSFGSLIIGIKIVKSNLSLPSQLLNPISDRLQLTC